MPRRKGFFLYENVYYSVEATTSFLARPEGGVVDARSCHIRRNLRFKASAEPVRDQGKADITRGGDFHIGVYDL